MRGYVRPFNFQIAYKAPNNSVRAFRHPFMQGIDDFAAAQYAGQGAVTDILCPTGADINAALVGGGYTIQLVDGLGNSVNFEWRLAGPASPGNVLVVFTALQTADQIATVFANAVSDDGTLQLLSTTPTADTLTLEALYKSSHGNYPLQPGQGGLVSAQQALLFAPDGDTMVFGDEGPIAMPARMGVQRMIATRTIPVTGQGETTDVD